jgi:hypothetical protein
MEDIPVAAHNCRYRHDMIDFRGVFQSKHQTNAQNSQNAERPNVL